MLIGKKVVLQLQSFRVEQSLPAVRTTLTRSSGGSKGGGKQCWAAGIDGIVAKLLLVHELDILGRIDEEVCVVGT
jgi:hypothetical protein